MDQDKVKSTSSTNASKTSVKCQQRHQEHNYTNPLKEETTVSKVEATTDANKSDAVDNQKAKNSGFKTGTSSQLKVDSNQKQAMQPTSVMSTDRQPLEVKSKGIKKYVFNRIKRSVEEMQKAAEMVIGGMTFQTASDTFNIPISTLRFFMAKRGILPLRRRGRGSIGIRDDDLMHPPFEIIHYRLPDIDKPV